MPVQLALLLGLVALVVWQVLLPARTGAIALDIGRQWLPEVLDGARAAESAAVRFGEKADPPAYARRVIQEGPAWRVRVRAGADACRELVADAASLGNSAYLGLALVPMPDAWAADEFLLSDQAFLREAARHLSDVEGRLRFLESADRILVPFLELDAVATFSVARPDRYPQEFLVRARALEQALRAYGRELDFQDPPPKLTPLYASWVGGLDQLADALDKAITSTTGGDANAAVADVQSFIAGATDLQQRIAQQQASLWRTDAADTAPRIRGELERRWEGIKRR